MQFQDRQVFSIFRPFPPHRVFRHVVNHRNSNIRDTNANRIAVLDGVRGLAILLVLIHHCVYLSGIDRSVTLDRHIFRFADSMWLGVDLFFVLSGFLITGILFDAKRSHHFFRNFYSRRVLRIFPLYYGFLAIIWALSKTNLTGEVGQAFLDTQGWYWLYLSNVQVALFGWQAPEQIGHFWSLAVEEQFYLLWPWLVWALTRRQLICVATVGFFVALTIRVALPFEMTRLGAYVLLPTRMDALSAGAILALLARGPHGLSAFGRGSKTLLLICSVTLAGLYLRQRRLDLMDPLVGTLGFSCIAAGFASFIAVTLQATKDGLLSRLLSAVPMVMLGKYSYGLYVVHVPLIYLLKNAGVQASLFPRIAGSSLIGVAAFTILASGLSLVVATVSYHLWEAPFLRLKRIFSYTASIPEATIDKSTTVNVPR